MTTGRCCLEITNSICFSLCARFSHRSD